MASTYSADLRIELIGSGEQAGTWGNTTNTNLGTLVEDAIAGAVTVAVAATPRALTALNGAVDEARQATLILTTSTGAAFTVYAPPVSKQYVIFNNTSYIATIGNATAVNGTTSTGGTTVAIPAGETTTVWSDGTNVASSNTYLVTGGTLTNPTNTAQVLADGATVSWNMNLGAVATLTLAGSRTMAAPTNLKIGASMLVINQDATGSRIITWNAVFKWSAGAAPVLSTAAGAKDILSLFSDGTFLYGSLALRGAT